MKLIYKVLDYIGRSYNKIILFIFIISIAILLFNNIPGLAFCNFYETDKSYEAGNNIWNNILTGLIGSSLFYWIVQS